MENTNFAILTGAIPHGLIFEKTKSNYGLRASGSSLLCYSAMKSPLNLKDTSAQGFDLKSSHVLRCNIC